MKFKELFEETLNEGTKVTSQGITVTFKDNVDKDEVMKLINAYDSQTWAINSYAQQKEANANNKTIIEMLSKLGNGVLTYKTGPSSTKVEIKF